MSGPDAADDPQPQADDDAPCWREARRLDADYPGWVITWLSPARQYRAYRFKSGGRIDTTLAAPTPDGLAEAITRAEQASPRVPSQRGRR